MTDSVIEVLPNFPALRWELSVNRVALGWHRQSHVCDYWAERIAGMTVTPTTVLHWADSRASNMQEMELRRKQQKNATKPQVARNPANENVQAEDRVSPPPAETAGEAGTSRSPDHYPLESVAELQVDAERMLRQVGRHHGMGHLMALFAQSRLRQQRALCWFAFMAGAKWWEWHTTGATMWASDQQLAGLEAARRYPYEPLLLTVDLRSENKRLKEELESMRKQLTEILKGLPC
jgi:hypothetical protein